MGDYESSDLSFGHSISNNICLLYDQCTRHWAGYDTWYVPINQSLICVPYSCVLHMTIAMTIGQIRPSFGFICCKCLHLPSRTLRTSVDRRLSFRRPSLFVFVFQISSDGVVSPVYVRHSTRIFPNMSPSIRSLYFLMLFIFHLNIIWVMGPTIMRCMLRCSQLMYFKLFPYSLYEYYNDKWILYIPV